MNRMVFTLSFLFVLCMSAFAQTSEVTTTGPSKSLAYTIPRDAHGTPVQIMVTYSPALNKFYYQLPGEDDTLEITKDFAKTIPRDGHGTPLAVMVKYNPATGKFYLWSGTAGVSASDVAEAIGDSLTANSHGYMTIEQMSDSLDANTRMTEAVVDTAYFGRYGGVMIPSVYQQADDGGIVITTLDLGTMTLTQGNDTIRGHGTDWTSDDQYWMLGYQWTVAIGDSIWTIADVLNDTTAILGGSFYDTPLNFDPYEWPFATQTVYVNAMSNLSTGKQSLSFGYEAIASADGAIALGDGCVTAGVNGLSAGYKSYADYAHSIALGKENISHGASSFATGYGSSAYNAYSIAMGDHSSTYGIGAVALGGADTAKGDASVALGNSSRAWANNSVAIGNGTIADQTGQVVVGEYNDTTDIDIFNVGNGTVSTRSNALAIHKNGDMDVQGSVKSSGRIYAADDSITFVGESGDVINCSLGNNFRGTLPANDTLSFSNPVDGQCVNVVITQGGGFVLHWSGVTWDGTEPTLPSTPNSQRLYSFLRTGGITHGSSSTSNVGAIPEDISDSLDANSRGYVTRDEMSDTLDLNSRGGGGGGSVPSGSLIDSIRLRVIVRDTTGVMNDSAYFVLSGVQLPITARISSTTDVYNSGGWIEYTTYMTQGTQSAAQVRQFDVIADSANGVAISMVEITERGNSHAMTNFGGNAVANKFFASMSAAPSYEKEASTYNNYPSGVSYMRSLYNMSIHFFNSQTVEHNFITVRIYYTMPSANHTEAPAKIINW